MAIQPPLKDVLERWRSRLEIINRADPSAVITLTARNMHDLTRLCSATHWAIGDGYEEGEES